jgi:hypothetical protein
MPCWKFRKIFNLNQEKMPLGSRLGELPLFGYGYVYRAPPKETRILWVKTPMRSIVPCPFPQLDDPLSVHEKYLTWYEEMYRMTDQHVEKEKLQIIYDLNRLGKNGATLYGNWEERFKDGLRFLQNHREVFKALSDLEPNQLSQDFRREHEFWLLFRIENLYSPDADVRQLVRDAFRRRVLPDFEWQLDGKEAEHLRNHLHYLRLRELTNRMAVSKQEMKSFWCFKRQVQDFEDDMGWEYHGSTGSCRMVFRGHSEPLGLPELQPEVMPPDGFGHHIYAQVLDGAVMEPPPPSVEQRDAAPVEPAAGHAVQAPVRGATAQPPSQEGSARKHQRRRHPAGDIRIDGSTMIVHHGVEGGPLAHRTDKPEGDAVADGAAADGAAAVVQEELPRPTTAETSETNREVAVSRFAFYEPLDLFPLIVVSRKFQSKYLMCIKYGG